ncbi:MAG TPA: hypothetical protein VK035_08245 [Kiloniellales bacterium]|nr:hypothetical protein [Kiloniellales bacterium]
MTLLRYALFCGAGAALASSAATMISARLEGRSHWAPVNATSHWLWGGEAGTHDEADLPHTAVGGATNIGASFFWGGLFGAFLSSRPPRTPAGMLRDASVVGALAGLVDYGLVPKRLTPGWELALSKRSVVITMAAMSVGLAGGGLAAQKAGGKDLASRRRFMRRLH